MEAMIEVSELYIAPQGEGPNLGRLSLFVRTRRCNLRCVWCDSKQTWNKDDPEYENYTKYTPTTLPQAMLKVALSGAFSVPFAVVFTGGEPLLWQRHLPEVIDAYYSGVVRATGVRSDFEVETAGTIVPSPALRQLCHFNVSPKLASAQNDHVPQEKLWNPDSTRAFLEGDAIFKLVVSLDP